MERLISNPGGGGVSEEARLPPLTSLRRAAMSLSEWAECKETGTCADKFPPLPTSTQETLGTEGQDGAGNGLLGWASGGGSSTTTTAGGAGKGDILSVQTDPLFSDTESEHSATGAASESWGWSLCLACAVLILVLRCYLRKIDAPGRSSAQQHSNSPAPARLKTRYAPLPAFPFIVT